MSIARILAGVLVGAAAYGAAPDSTWPMQRGGVDGAASRVWASRPATGLDEWHFYSKGARRYKQGLTVWASPALAVLDGRPCAFIGGADQTLHALDLQTKRRLWFKVTNGEIGDAPAVGTVDGRAVVFWGSADRFVYAHFANDGQRLWTRELVPPTTTQGDTSVSAPLLDGGVLYVCCFAYDKAMARSEQQGWLVALRMADGEELWRHEVSQGPLGAPVGREVDGRFVVFVAARRGRLQAYDVSAGAAKPMWTFQMPHEVMGSPVLEPHTDHPLLFLGSKFGDLIAVDARTGRKRWRSMTGNWVDNSACVGTVAGENVVFVGSHDYSLYALRAADGQQLWRRRLGGEMYSAPTFFRHKARPVVAAASLDNHVYVMDARNGHVITSFFTGQAVWDKVTKGETLWGSPAAVESEDNSYLVHGSYNGYTYVIPVDGEVSLRTKVQDASALWRGLGVVGAVFLLVVVPVVVFLPLGSRATGASLPR